MSQLDEEFYKYIGMKIKEARHLKKIQFGIHWASCRENKEDYTKI